MAEKEKTPLEDITEAADRDRKEMEEKLESFISDNKEKSAEKSDDTSEDKSEDSKDKKDSEKKQEPTKKNNIAAISAGISSAYADDELLAPKAQETKSKTKSSWPKAPDPKKDNIKVADGKDIMEVFWKEMWILFDKTVDFIVDTALGFVTYVLYPEKSEGSQTEIKKADAFVAGNTHCNKELELINKQKKYALSIYQEIDNNLQKAGKGEETEWKFLKKEPPFFSELLEVYKKAIADPNSPEAKMMEEFKKIPNIIAQRAENCEKITKSAIMLATMDEFVNPMTKEEEVKAAKEQYKDNKEELKKRLAEIEAVYSDPNKEQAQMEERIASRSKSYYDNICSNLNSICSQNEGDIEKIKTLSKEYMDGITKPLKDARDLVYGEMYQKDKNDKKHKSEAVALLGNVSSAIKKSLTSNAEPEKEETVGDIRVRGWSENIVFEMVKESLGR